MKKFLMMAALAGSWQFLGAQTIDEANNLLYYERYNSAAQQYANILQQEPENASALYGLVKTHLLNDSPEEALTVARLAAPGVKDEDWYSVAYGTALLQEGKKDSAALLFNAVLDATREKDARVLQAIAEAHLMAKEGDAAYALELVEKAMKRDKKNPALDVLRGDLYRKQLKGSEAYEAYASAISKDDKFALAHYRMGALFVAQNNPEMYVTHFTNAATADARYAPAMYQLYSHYFTKDPSLARDYFNRYMANADVTPQSEYALADLHYVNKEYDQAISKAQALMSSQGEKVKPRLYKLLAYSYAAKTDTAKALDLMQQYVAREIDSNEIAADYLSLADFVMNTENGDSLALNYLAQAAGMEKDPKALPALYKRGATLAATAKMYDVQADWLGKYYGSVAQPTNIDLFNWGLALFRAENYVAADTVFGRYVERYPEQSFGYYWQARSQGLQDSAMERGTAVPAYEKLVTFLSAHPDDTNYKKWLVEAYGYLASYEANKEKDYVEAKEYFEKVLEVEPENETAKKYIAILEKSIEKG